MATDRALEEMNAMLRVEIAKRLAAPQEDFLTQLVTLSDDFEQRVDRRRSSRPLPFAAHGRA